MPLDETPTQQSFMNFLKTALTAHVKKKHHYIVFLVASVVALIAILRFAGPMLRYDSSPLGLAVKGLLLMCVFSLVYLPYKLFVEGPSEIKRALRF